MYKRLTRHSKASVIISRVNKMKLFVAVAVVAAFAAVSGMSLGAAPEFAMVPDENGWKLVNVNDDPEPESFFTPENDIVFTLYTNEDQVAGQVVRWNDPSWIEGSGFNANLPTRLTIHGWNGGPTSMVNIAVRRALFEQARYNVIEVDWSRGASTINYISARNRVEPTGIIVARFLELLVEHSSLDVRTVTVIGHSLGAHVAGFIGKTLTSDLGAIVALDAAFPLFSINSPDARVHTDDALYVQSIHTNAGTLGFDEPVGHGNFYPNGGRSQPGCGIDISGNCAHGRAHEFFAESINSPVGFWSQRCASYAEITSGRCTRSGDDALMGGEPLDINAIGVFDLTTNNASPFARGPL